MGTQHTPGPWVAENLTETINTAKGPFSHKYAWQVVGAEGCVPAVARLAMVDAGPETVAANARLIAAAPDLLYALGNLLEGLDTQRAHGGGLPLYLFEDARAALAKARGEVI